MGKVADLSVFTPGGQPGAPNPSEGLVVLRQNQTAFMETIGVMPPESLTIADGAISPTTAVCIVDAEGGAPADDLTTINATLSDGGTLHDGMVILLSAKDASRVVTVKNSDAPNGVKTVDGKDIALSPEWSLVLQYVGGVWQQLNVSAPLKPATKTTIGGVKVGDGLSIKDGVLSANLATPEEAGRVKASETAAAGAVPLGGADGTLGEDWLKKVIDTGDYIASCKTSKPGYLLCNGAAVSRTTYKNLFAVIGTNFGEGDGSKTFNLPDFRDRTFWGANNNLMKVLAAGLPNIEANLSNNADRNVFNNAMSGAFYRDSSGGKYWAAVAYDDHNTTGNIYFDASRHDAIYGNSKTVQPPAVSVNIFIKY